ncbi:MAG: DUF971 domain-containing protein [Anaerolineales bacterium]|nr:MAG: DUF971 domain-containing protein [Anaerolineales bacterium]
MDSGFACNPDWRARSPLWALRVKFSKSRGGRNKWTDTNGGIWSTLITQRKPVGRFQLTFDRSHLPDLHILLSGVNISALWLVLMKPINMKASRRRAVLTIEWSRLSSCDLSFADLRAACPCAECRGTHGATKAKPLTDGLELTIRSDNASQLESITPVGNYAIQISWKDGHSHGIYSWDYLRELCETRKHRDNGES